MAKKLPILRVAGPTLAVSLLLFAACTVSAVFLYRLHARTAETLTDDLDSRKTAAQIETTLRKLITLVKTGSDGVETLHEKITELLTDAHDLASSDQETELLSRLERSVQRYQLLWDQHREGGDPNLKQEALKVLSETVPHAGRLRSYNAQEIEKSEAALRATIKWFAWGLVIVGSVGCLGGILFGYGVARTLRQSIYRLSVRIRDAADKLREELPTVTLTRTDGSDGIDYLHDQMQTLVPDIEHVVERLQQRTQEVLRAEQLAAVGQLAAGVAHELRNPLTAVKMLVQNSREDLQSRGLPAEDLGIIEQEIRRLEHRLQAFLDFARPPRTERRPTDVAALVQDALTLVGGRARQQHVAVQFSPPAQPVLIEADGEQLRQLVVNLTMNALDAMPEGGDLTIDLGRSNGAVRLRVRDSGPGVAAELRPRLFQPFVSGKETGLGLGLVVSKRIAEAHGGSLTLDASVQGGACFVLELPSDPR